MPLERIFRLSELRAPDNKSGGFSSGSKSSPQAPLENPSTTLSLPSEYTQLQEAQQTLQAIGLAAQSLGRGRKRIDLPTEEIAAEYLNGAVVTEMAQRYRVSTRTIYRRLHEAGLPRHTSIIENVGITERPFNRLRDLSPDGQKLWECLIEERGDIDQLPIYAVEDKFDLKVALDELRRWGFLDESDLERVKLRNSRRE